MKASQGKYSLQEVNGCFGTSRVHVSFSLSEQKQIMSDTGKLSNGPDKYIEVIRGYI